jgi:3-keto-5-aminohexanoate cleavage enzyme
VNKVIMTVAPTGSWPTKKDNPNLPITPEEIADETYRAYQAGAAVVHLHGRDPETGKPTPDVRVFADYIERIRARCDIVIQVSTGGGAVALGLTPEQRINAVRQLRPEMASLNAGSMNFGRGVFSNPPEVIEAFAREMVAMGVVPEFECFDMGMINNVRVWVLDQGIMKPPLQFSLVLGVVGGIAASPKNLLAMAHELPSGCTWQVIGIGRHQIPLGAVAMLLGGSVRVGFEDNVYLRKGVLARSNAELVEKAVSLANDFGLEVATPAEARQILRIGTAL